MERNGNPVGIRWERDRNKVNHHHGNRIGTMEWKTTGMNGIAARKREAVGLSKTTFGKPLLSRIPMYTPVVENRFPFARGFFYFLRPIRPSLDPANWRALQEYNRVCKDGEETDGITPTFSPKTFL